MRRDTTDTTPNRSGADVERRYIAVLVAYLRLSGSMERSADSMNRNAHLGCMYMGYTVLQNLKSPSLWNARRLWNGHGASQFDTAAMRCQGTTTFGKEWQTDLRPSVAHAFTDYCLLFGC